MLNFPASTIFSKRIPKELLLKKISAHKKHLIINEIDSVIWRYKLSEDTLNINAGNYVTEIEFLEINLKSKNISKETIELIDSSIPYHSIFILIYEEMAQLHISYKKEKNNGYEIEKYFHTPWKLVDDINLKITGLDLDKVYENFFSQITDKIDISKNTLSEAVELSVQREKLEAKIQTLQNKIQKEKQYNKQVKLLSELRDVQEKLKKTY